MNVNEIVRLMIEANCTDLQICKVTGLTALGLKLVRSQNKKI